jgi:hypothetical protein
VRTRSGQRLEGSREGTVRQQENQAEGDAVPAEDPAVDDLAALREALLAHYDEENAAWRLPGAAIRVGMRLDRFKLGWLIAPWALIIMLIDFPRVMRGSRTKGPLVRLYAQASGHDLDVSRAEVRRIQAQLASLDERSPQRLGLGVAGSRPASRAELEATAAALLAYYLGGRQTDDALLAQAQAAYAAYEEGVRASSAVMAERGMRAASRYAKAHRAEAAAAMARYLAAWRRWVDHAEARTEPATAGLRAAARPAGDEDHAAPREVWIEQLLALLRDDEPADWDWDRVEERIRDRLARLKLAWLAVPVAIVGGIISLIISLPRLVRTTIRDQDRSLGLYRRLSGTDDDVASAELWRIRRQLMYLERCLPEAEDHGSSPGRSALAGPAARAAATRALLGYFLAGRPADDALLAETQAAYAALEQLNERDLRAWRALGWRGRRRHRTEEAAAKQQRDEAERGYCEAWRRWLEQQPADRAS